MAKSFTIVLFSAFLILVNMKSGLQLLVYEIAKPIITKNFCVNLDEPELKCNGKCHLKEVLLDEVQKSNSSTPINVPPPNLKIDFISYFINNLSKNTELVSSDYYRNYFITDLKFISREDKNKIFHPPIV